MLNLLWPWMLLLLPLPLAYRLWRKPAPASIQALRAPILLRAAGTEKKLLSNSWTSRLFLALLGIVWTLTLFAAARPVWIGEPVALPVSGRDILMAVDISRSMEREDMVVRRQSVSRLVAVKAVVGQFVKQRTGDRLGLILFGERAYLQTPLTFDRETLQTLLNEAQIGFAGNGTAIGDAIGLAIKRLEDRPQHHRVLILMTDGANTAGELEPLRAASLAATAGVKIYTIGIGSDSQESWGLFGLRTRNPSSDLDEKTLQQIAQTTGGLYFRARNPQELAAIYDELNRLEPVDQDAETIRPVAALYYWPLGLAFVLSLLIAAWNSRRSAYG